MRKRIVSFKCRRAGWVGACLLVSLSLGFVSNASADELARRTWAPEFAGSLRPAEGQPPASDVIRALYEKAESMLLGSGHVATIEVSSFRHVARADFEGVDWLDLVTMGGRTVDLGKHFFGQRGDGAGYVFVSATWNERHNERAIDFLKSGRPTALDAANEADHPDFGKGFVLNTPGLTIGISAYRVHLELHGEWRDYDAAILWRRSPDGSVTSNIQDRVLPIDLLVWVEDEPAPQPAVDDLPIRASRIADQQLFGPQEKRTCEFFAEAVQGPTVQKTRAMGHSFGFHALQYRFNAVRGCTNDCDAFCESAVFDRTFCGESTLRAFTDSTVTDHKTAFDTAVINDEDENETKCIGAVQCEVGECKTVCPGLSFSISVTAGPGGGGFSFGNASEAIDGWKETTPIRAECEEETDPLICPTFNTTTHALSLGGKLSLPTTKSAYRLDRVEESDVMHHGVPVNYVMDEWALFERRPAGDTQLSRTSSVDYAMVRGTLASDATSSNTGKSRAPQSILLIEAPNHPENDRAIPLPDLVFDSKALPEQASRGRMIVRFDVDDHRVLQDVHVIQDNMGGVSPEVLEAIKDRFSLEFASEKQHRVVTYVVLDVGETISVVDHVMVLPKCCPFCLPWQDACHEP